MMEVFFFFFNLMQKLIVLWGRWPPVLPAPLCYRGELEGHRLYNTNLWSMEWFQGPMV